MYSFALVLLCVLQLRFITASCLKTSNRGVLSNCFAHYYANLTFLHLIDFHTIVMLFSISSGRARERETAGPDLSIKLKAISILNHIIVHFT